MGRIGIWIDKDKAMLVKMNEAGETLEVIESNMEHFNATKGESGTHFRGGIQATPQDRKYLEREKRQHKDYFKTIIPKIKGATSLAIFGPAQTPDRFADHIKRYHSQLFTRIRVVQRADSMTDNQVKALVRDFYNK